MSEPLWLEMNSIDNTTITSRIRTLPLLTGYRQDYVLVLCMAGFRTLTQFFESGPDCLAPGYMAVCHLRSRQHPAVERSLHVAVQLPDINTLCAGLCADVTGRCAAPAVLCALG